MFYVLAVPRHAKTVRLVRPAGNVRSQFEVGGGQ
jgi:hypothetical protein